MRRCISLSFVPFKKKTRAPQLETYVALGIRFQSITPKVKEKFHISKRLPQQQQLCAFPRRKNKQQTVNVKVKSQKGQADRSKERYIS